MFDKIYKNINQAFTEDIPRKISGEYDLVTKSCSLIDLNFFKVLTTCGSST